MKVPPFLFVRHGETAWNAEGRLQGRRDIPLNEIGRAQARAAGLTVAARLAERGVAASEASFVVSPLGRTCETARECLLTMHRDAAGFASDDRLREFSFGDWEGLTWPEVKALHPLLLKDRRRDKWNFVPPNGESYAMLAERVRPWLDTVTERTVAVSHGGVARVLMVLVGGLSRLAAPQTEVLQGRVLRFGSRDFAWL